MFETYNSQPDLSPQERMSICKKCPLYDSMFGRCRECGCFLKAKVQLAAEECPKGKW
jgi:hypothetical protein